MSSLPATQPITGPQTLNGSGGGGGTISDSVMGALGLIGGVGEPIPGSVRRYAQLRQHPTVVIARTASSAPILSADQPTLETEGLPERVQAEAWDLIERTYWQFIRHAITAWDFGYASWELCWEERDGALVICRAKPLNAVNTEPQVDDTGEFAGLKQGRDEIPLMQAAHYANDPYADNLFGESRFEGRVIRRIFHAWDQVLDRIVAYTTKVAGVVPIIYFSSQGNIRNSAGQEISAAEAAQQVLKSLATGKGVSIPSDLPPAIEQLLRMTSGAGSFPVEMLRAWSIQFLEVKGDHTSGMLDVARQLDRWILRAYSVPERAVTEGDTGTKAEAATHADLVLVKGQDQLTLMTATYRDQVLRKQIALNHGAAVANRVVLHAPIISDEMKAMMQRVTEKLLTTPATLALVEPIVDTQRLIEQAGVPTREGERPGTIVEQMSRIWGVR